MSSKHKTLKRAALTILVVIIAVAGTMVYSFFASIHAHRQQIEAASKALRGHSKDQWKQLFEEVKEMVEKHPGASGVPQDQWPPSIA